MNLRENKEGYMGGFGERNGKKEMMSLCCNLKRQNINKKCKKNHKVSFNNRKSIC